MLLGHLIVSEHVKAGIFYRTVQKVFYGNVNAITESMKDISLNEKLSLAALVLLIFILGVYPQPVINITKDAVTSLLAAMK